jgi:hypothetical protein
MKNLDKWYSEGIDDPNGKLIQIKPEHLEKQLGMKGNRNMEFCWASGRCTRLNPYKVLSAYLAKAASLGVKVLSVSPGDLSMKARATAIMGSYESRIEAITIAGSTGEVVPVVLLIREKSGKFSPERLYEDNYQSFMAMGKRGEEINPNYIDKARARANAKEKRTKSR